MNREINASHALPAIHVPTLVIAKAEDRDFPLSEVRELASRIAGARLVEFPGDEHFFWVGEYEGMLDEIERFVAEFRDQEAELERSLATILFTDIVGSTERAAQLGDRRWRDLVQDHHARVRGQLARFRGREIDTAGDGFFASFDGPARAILCAQSIVAAVRELRLEVRAGLHTGECELHEGKLSGLAVSIGARVASEAAPGTVVVSSTVKDLVAGSGIEFTDLGARELKGVPGEWSLYVVSG
jgi:class 3 adenylate cyclase